MQFFTNVPAKLRPQTDCMGELKISLVRPFFIPSTWSSHVLRHRWPPYHLVSRYLGVGPRLSDLFVLFFDNRFNSRFDQVFILVYLYVHNSNCIYTCKLFFHLVVVFVFVVVVAVIVVVVVVVVFVLDDDDDVMLYFVFFSISSEKALTSLLC